MDRRPQPAPRPRAEEGLGLIELLIALTVLLVGILAIVAGFGSGYVALNASSRTSSSSALADRQMERFRSLDYQSVCLSSASGDAAYTADAPTGTAVPTCATTDPALAPTQDPVAGPDRLQYRIDSYVVWNCPVGTLSTASPYTLAAPGCLAAGAVVSNPVKLVRIVVLDHTTGKRYVTEDSTFDASTAS